MHYASHVLDKSYSGVEDLTCDLHARRICVAGPAGMSGKYAFMAARSQEATMETFTCSLTNKGQKDTKPSFERIDFSPSDGAEEEARSEADAVQRGRF